jgi:Ca-activated chloride channel family protein
MSFANPAWLWALLALPALALVALWTRRRDRARLARFVDRPLWPRVTRQPAARWGVLREALLLAGAVGLILALARPQWGIVREQVEREGVDIVLVLDTSGSMATPDVAPNRFFLARAALANLVARLEGDRFALLAFEGDAYPLVPLTLDADALGLFLDTLEPGLVPNPGSSLGGGLARGLELFVDAERRNRVVVLVSDGEDLEGDVQSAVDKAKQAGVIVHTVGVGTEAGQPVPDFDREGRQVGFKKDAQGTVVVSRLHPETLAAIAQGTGGRAFRITPSDTSLKDLASAIEALEQRGLAREFAYRRKERFQVPLGIGLASLALALLLPLPPWPARWRLRRAGAARGAAALVALLLWPCAADAAETGRALDELLLRPRRYTSRGQDDYAKGQHPDALRAFERAAGARPNDPRAKFNLADGLYKNGRFGEAAELWRALGQDSRAPLAGPSRFNLGNSLYNQKDYPGAVRAYRDALQVLPNDEATRRNLELALRALLEQQQQQQQQQQNQQNQDQREQQDQKSQGQPQQDPQRNPKPQGGPQQPRPQSEQEREQQRFQKEAGMPKERAMQLLEALQRNERDQQKKRLAAKARRRPGQDW